MYHVKLNTSNGIMLDVIESTMYDTGAGNDEEIKGMILMPVSGDWYIIHCSYTEYKAYVNRMFETDKLEVIDRPAVRMGNEGEICSDELKFMNNCNSDPLMNAASLGAIIK